MGPLLRNLSYDRRETQGLSQTPADLFIPGSLAPPSALHLTSLWSLSFLDGTTTSDSD